VADNFRGKRLSDWTINGTRDTKNGSTRKDMPELNISGDYKYSKNEGGKSAKDIGKYKCETLIDSIGK